MLCVLYKNLSTIAIGHTRLLLQLPSRRTADRTNPLSRVQEDADHNLMDQGIEDVWGIDMAMVLLFTEHGTGVNVYLHTKHIRYFTACFSR